jgi:para-aminobenzoate synthetase component 1
MGDFDFNVIIRSIIYDDQLKISKIGIGSAITLQSNFNAEWDECWLKSQSLINQ